MLFTIETRSGQAFGTWPGTTEREAFRSMLRVYACDDPYAHDPFGPRSEWVIRPFTFRFVNPACFDTQDELRALALETALAAALGDDPSGFADGYAWNAALPEAGTEHDRARQIRRGAQP